MSYSWLKEKYKKKTEQRSEELRRAGFKESVVEATLGTSTRRTTRKKTRGGSGSSPTVRETITQSQETQAQISGRTVAPTETATDIGIAQIEGRVVRKGPKYPTAEIVIGPRGPGPTPDLVTRKEALKEKKKRKPPGSIWMGIPEQPDQGFQERRTISPQETVSVESERLRREEEERGRAIIDAPLEQSKRVSELIVGPVENIPKTETAPRAAASAVEWIITLPAETLRSPVTMTETAQDIREIGFMRMVGESGQAIARDPSGAGVKAGLTAALIVLPAAKVVRAARGAGRSGRTTGYEVTMTPDDIPAARVDYISDFVFKSESKGIRGRGMVAMETGGAEAAIDVRSFTVPEGKAFKTTVEARMVGRSRMDLLTGDKIRGTVLSEEIPGGTKTKSVFKRTKQEGQLDILGRPQPEQELAARMDITHETPVADLTVGRKGVRKSTLSQPLDETVDVSGTKLISEARTPKGIRRKTYTREAIVDKKAFEEKHLDIIFRDLGFTQDTLRGPPGGGGQALKTSAKDMVMAERAMQQAASSFQKTRPPTTPPKTPQTPPSRVPQVDIKPMPTTGLGALPRPTIIPKEEPQIIRYPPSEAPPGAVPGGVIGLDIASSLGVAEITAQTQLRTQRGRSRRKTRVAQGLAIDADQAIVSRQDVAQKQVLDLMASQKTTQRTRQQTMIPAIPTRYAPTRQLIPTVRGPRAPRMPWLLPPPTLGPGKRKRKAARLRPDVPGRGFIYTPSLGGMISGRELEKAPVGPVTGLELRPPVKKKKKRRR